MSIAPTSGPRSPASGPSTAGLDDVWRRFDARRWMVLPHRLVTGSAPETVADLVTGPTGVYAVVRTTGRATSDTVTGVGRLAQAVSEAIPARYHGRVTAVLHLSDPSPLASVEDARPAFGGGALVADSATLEHVMRRAPRVLSTGEVGLLHARLAEAFPAARRESAAPDRRRLLSRWRRTSRRRVA